MPTYFERMQSRGTFSHSYFCSFAPFMWTCSFPIFRSVCPFLSSSSCSIKKPFTKKPFTTYRFNAIRSGNVSGCGTSQEWIFNVDSGGVNEYHARSNGGQLCAQAHWSISQNLPNCTWYLFVPSNFADITDLGIGFLYSSFPLPQHVVFHLNEEQYTDQYAPIP